VKDFITGIKPIVFINQHIQPAPDPDPDPDPPAPTGPLNKLIESDAGLNGYTAVFTPTTGNVIVRVVGRKNAAGNPGIAVSATQAASTVPLTTIAEVVGPGGAGAGFAYAAGIRGLVPGVNCTLTFATLNAAGRAAVRIGELATMPADWASASTITSDGQSNMYYLETGPGAAAGSLMLSAVGWMSASAYPISSTGDDAMWSTTQGAGTGGMAAWFGQTPSPGGEDGWGGYVYYSNYGTQPNGVALLFAVKGGTLP